MYGRGKGGIKWNSSGSFFSVPFLFFFFNPSLLNSDSIAEKKRGNPFPRSSIGTSSTSVSSVSYWKISLSTWLRTRYFSGVKENSPTALDQSHQCLFHTKIHFWKSQTVTRKRGMFTSERLSAQRNPTPSRIWGDFVSSAICGWGQIFTPRSRWWTSWCWSSLWSACRWSARS